MTGARTAPTRAMARAAVCLAVACACSGAAAEDDAAPADASAAPLERRTETGPVAATVRVSPPEPVIGDAVTLELEVRAEPDVELLMPAFGEALGRFAIVDFAPSQRILPDGATVAIQRYTIQPSRSGPQSIPPLLVEFVDRRPGRPPAPEGEDAYELLTERVAFAVRSVLPDDAPLELRDARGELPPLATPGPPLWPIALAALAAAGAAAPFAWRAAAAWRARARRRSAYDVARGELDALLYGPRPADARSMDAFYVALSGIVRRYVEDRFALLAPELTTEEFLDALKDSPELLRSHQQLLRDFLRDADLVKFAHHLPGPEDVERSTETARRFLEETREGLDAAPPARADAAVGAARA